MTAPVSRLASASLSLGELAHGTRHTNDFVNKVGLAADLRRLAREVRP